MVKYKFQKIKIINIYFLVLIKKNMDSGTPATNIMNASMNLMRRLPPKDVPKNLGAISELIKDDDIRDDVQVKTD